MASLKQRTSGLEPLVAVDGSVNFQSLPWADLIWHSKALDVMERS
jgi:hypothetical protein